MTRQKLIDWISDLELARKEAYSDGLWDRVNLLQLCIDDAKKELALM